MNPSPEQLLTEGILAATAEQTASWLKSHAIHDCGAIALRAVYTAAAAGNVTCKEAVRTIEVRLAKAGLPLKPSSPPVDPEP